MAGPTEAVVDASTTLKWISEEEGTPAALKLRDEHVEGTTTLSAPDLILYELANALRYRPGFDDEKVAQALGDVIDLQIDLIAPGSELLRQSARDAYLYNTTVYDSCYLALGELMGIEVYTSNKRFYEKAKASGIMKLTSSAAADTLFLIALKRHGHLGRSQGHHPHAPHMNHPKSRHT
jgi:predicted nucleic acid-binding protein